MKKFLLFSIVFIATAASVTAQKKISKKTVINEKKAVVSVKRSGTEQEKPQVSKNPKQMNLQRTKPQPTIVPAEIKDERAN